MDGQPRGNTPQQGKSRRTALKHTAGKRAPKAVTVPGIGSAHYRPWDAGIDACVARDAMILSEIIGPPIAKRSRGKG